MNKFKALIAVLALIVTVASAFTSAKKVADYKLIKVQHGAVSYFPSYSNLTNSSNQISIEDKGTNQPDLSDFTCTSNTGFTCVATIDANAGTVVDAREGDIQ